jgi:hypothetical protein
LRPDEEFLDDLLWKNHWILCLLFAVV